MLKTDVEEFKRERPEGVILQEGACRFCGQMSQIQTLKFWTEEEVDEAVTEQCDCQEAKIYADKKQKKERAYTAIENKFDKENLKKYEPIISALKATVDLIIEYKITGASIEIGKGCKIKLKDTKKVESRSKKP